MQQDCQQSLKYASAGGSIDSKDNPGGGAGVCRFLDANGLCYSFQSAQVLIRIMWFRCCESLNVYLQEYCSKHPEGACHDGGSDWAVKPVGDAENVHATQVRVLFNMLNDTSYSC